ncbi:LPXTG cell wall anchor domain-containing protein [Actinoplanes sp. TRM 88003]|uniref:LPXTG cell wall anchor domain-containing protein n=1 Tax=Paractinoplanes aksuensis TaxID=2939490 RepID=A0ABT1DFQ9_9ACTN|nr:LPXTG cell wall anchor domain-containing protein [Actinoplanes aksuensis]MCO8269679.1 LPXTG cell wall anchor domain-containing protein [Actinoplanes aksuensis]
MILRRIASVLGLAFVLAGAAVTPAQAAAEPVHSGLNEFNIPAEFPQGYVWKVNLRGFASTTGGDTSPLDPSRLSITLTIPAGVTYAPGDGDSSGPCEVVDSLLTCRHAGPVPDGSFTPLNFPIELRVGEDTPLGTKLPFTLKMNVAGGEDDWTVDNTRTWVNTVAGSADMGIAVKDLAVAEDAVTYTVVLRNYGPQTTTKFTFHETFSVINWHGTGVGPGATCRFTSGKNQCTVRKALAPGQETEVKRTVPIAANSKWRGTKVPVELYVYDSPSNFAYSEWFLNPINEDNDKTSYVADLTGLNPPASSTPTPTASPTPGDGSGGGGGGDLPITGAATMPLLAGGALLLLLGAGAVLVGRRRR